MARALVVEDQAMNREIIGELLATLVAVGLIDTSANVLVAAATTHGALGIVAAGCLLVFGLAWLVQGRLAP